MNDLTFAEDVQERKRRMLPMALGGLQSTDGTLTNTVQPGRALPSALRTRLGKVQQQLDDMDGQEVDTSALQAFARQQGESGQASMLNALAAQYAGENFQPVQAQFLKRAAAAAEPMKIGGGMMTPQGQFIKDPFAQRDQRRTALERQALGLERMATEEERTAQAREDRLSRDRQSDEFRRMGLDLQKQGLDLRRDLAANKPDTQSFTRATKLREEFGKKADKVAEGVRHAETTLTLLTDPTIARDPTKQVALVFSFGKMLDDQSVVRESEYALISNARGVFDSVLQKPDQIMTGARLTEQQLKSMRQIAQQLYAGAAQRRKDLTDAYRGIAERNKIPVEDVLPVTLGGGSGGSNDLAAAAAAELERRRKGGQ
jgi:hypothetical protein